jgi:D-alanyl-D-alanine dipeptidase
MDHIRCSLKLKKSLWHLVISCLLAVSVPGVIIHAQSEPPIGCNPCKSSELVELVKLDSTIKLDIRYATDKNFSGRAVYTEPRAFLLRTAAEALLSAHNWLKEYGYGLIVYDAYRPWSVTKIFWDITPINKRAFVADPSTGSVHNRGCAVDVGLYDILTGMEVQMPGEYDEMTNRSFINYTGGTFSQRTWRNLLRKAMEREGKFSVYSKEWWHYDFKDFRDYAILNIPFSSISNSIENRKSESGKTR